MLHPEEAGILHLLLTKLLHLPDLPLLWLLPDLPRLHLLDPLRRHHRLLVLLPADPVHQVIISSYLLAQDIVKLILLELTIMKPAVVHPVVLLDHLLHPLRHLLLKGTK